MILKIIQPWFNGTNTFGTMKLCSRQGKFELMSVNHSARRHTRDTFSIYFSIKVCCVFSLELSRLIETFVTST